MSRPANPVLVVLVATTVVVTAALAAAGWRLLDQQRAIDEQRAGDQLESSADALAAGIRGKLAEAGERLSGWLSNPTAIAPAIEGAIVFAARPDSVDVNPPGGLPFVPVVVAPRLIPVILTTLEAMEFGADQLAAVAEGYRTASKTPDAGVRAAALLRLGRVLRKLRDYDGALTAYRQLTELRDVQTDGLPAELAGLDGQIAAYQALGDTTQVRRVSDEMRTALDAGRYAIPRGTAEFYRDRFSDARPESWRMADALSDVWRDAGGSLPSRGQRVFIDGATGAIVIWRSNGTHAAALVADANHFFDVGGRSWQLADPEGRRIAGSADAPSRSVARIIGNADDPWTLRVWGTPATAAGASSRTILVWMMGAMLAFVWGASYFMARAIRREAAVARLQSDFVAAVSHEFRSPLTSVRQMAEMLDADRVPTEERRHAYYRLLAGEATRLQRLVETLLNFGKMEAGAERYRLLDLDAAAVVRDVVAEIEPHARQSGMTIELNDAPEALPVLADHSALSVALRNLIDNAIKYSPGQAMVRVECRSDGDRVVIAIVDGGVGIARSEQRAIFDKFVRGRAAIDANIKGTGLGLSMVQQIVSAHGGEIGVESEPGRGSTFTIVLPLAARASTIGHTWQES